MHSHSTAPWTHGHAFLGVRHDEHERRTWGVVALTAAMMLVEIVGGGLFGSIALVADGWHMATHVIALAIAGFAYLFARRHARDARFSLGTGKFGELAAFASAIILGLIALGVGYELVLRLFHPVVIHFEEAVPIAGLGLCVNLASAWLLRTQHDHDHGDHLHRGSSHHHADRGSPRAASSRHQFSGGLRTRSRRCCDLGGRDRGAVAGVGGRMELHGSAGGPAGHDRDGDVGGEPDPLRRQRAARRRSRSGACADHPSTHRDRRRPGNRPAYLAARARPRRGDGLGRVGLPRKRRQPTSGASKAWPGCRM